MPVEPLPSDIFTKGNLVVGFPYVEFTPISAAGVKGVPVPLGILQGFEYARDIALATLRRGDKGFQTIDRELVSRFEPFFTITTYNFKANIAQYIMASDVATAVAAGVTAASTSLLLQQTNPFNVFNDLTHGDIVESSVEVTFQTITNEAVGTGDGASGGTQGDYSLDQKIKAIGDVTGFTVGGVDKSGILVAGSTPTAGQIAIEVGEEDSTTTGSGAITFGSGEIPANNAAIVATYTPSFSTTGTDIVNLTDFVFDPLVGRIRFRHAGADASPFRLTGDQAPLNVAYNYNRRAHTLFNYGQQLQSDGEAVIKLLTNVGSNFIHRISSATIRITDQPLVFGAEDFVRATMRMNVNDAGGSAPFGTIEWSSEAEAAA